MTRDVYTVLEDVSMYRAGKAIREWLASLSGLIPRLNQTPNAYYGTTVDGLVLIEYYGGPSSIGTPYGQWAATGGGTLKNPKWLDEAKERLGLELLMSEINKSQGTFGPVWAITKDLDGNPLPKANWQELGFWPGITSTNAFGELSGVRIVQELNAWVEAHKQERPRAVFHCKQTPDEYPFHLDSHWLRSNWLDAKWHDMSKQIAFVAWDDRVDPQFHVESVYDPQDWTDLQTTEPWLAELPVHHQSIQKRFKVLDFDGNVVLIIDCKAYPEVIQKVWARDSVGQDPVALAAKLLSARGYALDIS